jgi:hypothetical protein
MYKYPDFASCLFNPLEKNLLVKYPQLIVLLPKCKDDEKVLRFIISMYDPNNPVVRENRDPLLRKKSCAVLAGFDLIKDEVFLEEIFNYTNEEIVEKTDRFLKEFVHIRLWSMICANEQTFFEYSKRMMKPVEEAGAKEKDLMSAIAIKSKLSEDMDAINNRLDSYYDKLYGDADLKNKVQKVRISPESMSGTV